MKRLNILLSAFRALQRNKMRSFLTMLGIIIGVGAVIAMLAIGQGAEYSVEAADLRPRHECPDRLPRITAAGRDTTGCGDDDHADRRRCGGDRAVNARLWRLSRRAPAPADR